MKQVMGCLHATQIFDKIRPDNMNFLSDDTNLKSFNFCRSIKI
jgi:hypothetical protein